MMKSISYRFVLCLCVLFSVANLSADTLTVTWTGAIGELENTIMADTSADGSQAHDVYKLEANKVYLQLATIVLESSCEIVGAFPVPDKYGFTFYTVKRPYPSG